MVVHPHDPDKSKAHQKSNIGGPGSREFPRQAIAAVMRHFEFEDQQRDGDGKNAIGERLDPRCFTRHAVKLRPPRRDDKCFHPRLQTPPRALQPLQWLRRGS
jgi:hypothetical protein